MNTGEIGKRIRERRKAKGLTQDELARAVGMSRTHLIHLERGKNASVAMINRIAATLGVSASDLFAEEPPPPVDIRDEMLSQLHEVVILAEATVDSGKIASLSAGSERMMKVVAGTLRQARVVYEMALEAKDFTTVEATVREFLQSVRPLTNTLQKSAPLSALLKSAFFVGHVHDTGLLPWRLQKYDAIYVHGEALRYEPGTWPAPAVFRLPEEDALVVLVLDDSLSWLGILYGDVVVVSTKAWMEHFGSGLALVELLEAGPVGERPSGRVYLGYSTARESPSGSPPFWVVSTAEDADLLLDMPFRRLAVSALIRPRQDAMSRREFRELLAPAPTLADFDAAREEFDAIVKPKKTETTDGDPRS